MTAIDVKLVLLATFWCIATVPSTAAQNRMRGPDDRPVSASKISFGGETSTAKLIGRGAIQAYSRFISPVDGPRSPSYPTSTAYGRQAIQQHGFLLGVILIADRLLHEAEFYSGPRVVINGHARYYDPIESNIYWWHPPPSATPALPRQLSPP
jgi:putative component of membrane protein insertase Oxa1/YidC/SpoIIIJ protein YidD